MQNTCQTQITDAIYKFKDPMEKSLEIKENNGSIKSVLPNLSSKSEILF